MALGEKIHTLREERNLSQKELASLAGVTTGVIAEWEADETAPNLKELAYLCKALNVSSDVLLEVTTEDVAPSVPVLNQESKPLVVSAKKKKTGMIVGAAVLIVTIVIGVFFLFRATPFVENAAAIERADASVVTIFCYDYDGELAATGSGFLAFDSKTIITNYHVMTSAYTCKISTNQDISYEVSKILCYSKEQDIAILQLAENSNLKPLDLGDSSVIKKGQTVVAIGSPLGIKNTVSTGVLSGRLMQGNMDVLQFTAPISSGSSGGALFDNNGKVIGITYAGYADGQNLNFAIPIELANNLYKNKVKIYDVSSIYVDEHPYIMKLEDYKDVPEISVDELLRSPGTYHEKTVKIVGFFSSYHREPVSFLPGKYLDYIFITTESNVTGNGETDYDLYSKAGVREIKYLNFGVLVSDEDEIYISDTVLPGDKICWIGEVQYEDFLGLVTFNGITDLCYSID